MSVNELLEQWLFEYACRHCLHTALHGSDILNTLSDCTDVFMAKYLVDYIWATGKMRTSGPSAEIAFHCPTTWSAENCSIPSIYVVLAYLQELVENERESQYEIVISELSRLHEAVGDVLPFRIYARLVIALKILVLFRMLKQSEKLVLPRLNAYFPRSGLQLQTHYQDRNMLEHLNGGQQQFRSFFLQLIADADRRHEYFAVRHEQEYGTEFVARTKELMCRFVSALNNLLPLCAVDRLLGKNTDERLVAEITSMNSAVFEMLLDAVHGRDALTADQVIDLLHCIHKDTSLTSKFPKMFSLQLLSSSEEAGKEIQDTLAESAQPGRCCKLPRISDIDMFGSDVAEHERQHMSNDTADNCVHSSGEIEVVLPSLVPHSKSSCIQNTKALMGSSTVLDSELVKQKQKVGSYPDIEMLNDVEPDGSQLPTCVKPSCYEENSGHPTVVTVVDSTPVILTGHLSADNYDKVMPSPLSVNSNVLEKGALLPDDQDISATILSLSDDVAQFNTESHSIADDNNEIICDLVTQSSTADQSFHSCTTVDLDSSLSGTIEEYQQACSQPLSCKTVEDTSTDRQVVRNLMHVNSALNESHVSDSDSQSLLGGSHCQLIIPSSYSFDQFEVLCCTESEVRHQLLLPPIEQHLRHPSVQRSCIIKLYRAENLDVGQRSGQVLKMYS